MAAANSSGLENAWSNCWKTFCISFGWPPTSDASVPKGMAIPSLGTRVIPGRASEICEARHVLPSSDRLGVQWPSRPAGHTLLASGSAVWPLVCRRVSQTCGTRRSCSGQSSGNKPQGSPGEPLYPSDFRQLGNRWSCHLLLWQKTALGRVAKPRMTPFSLSSSTNQNASLELRTKHWKRFWKQFARVHCGYLQPYSTLLEVDFDWGKAVGQAQPGKSYAEHPVSLTTTKGRAEAQPMPSWGESVWLFGKALLMQV